MVAHKDRNTFFFLEALGETAIYKKSAFFPMWKGQASFFNRIQTLVTGILGGSAVLLLAEMKVSPDYFIIFVKPSQGLEIISTGG